MSGSAEVLDPRESQPPVARWPSRAIIVLGLIGLAVAVYLAITYAQDRSPYCAGLVGCDVVRTSAYATVFRGVLAVPTFGIIGFVVILTLELLRYRSKLLNAGLLSMLTYGAALAGFLYSGLYLTALELFVLHAVCLWCIVTSVVVTSILVLSIIDLRVSRFAQDG